MSSSLAGLFILATLFTGALLLWRANILGEQLNGSAQKASANLQGLQVRTRPTITSAAADRNNNTLTLTVNNDGNTSVGLSSFAKMDLIVLFDGGVPDPLELTYTPAITPDPGEWTRTSISGEFEPDVWNPEEELVITATFPGDDCYAGTVILSTPNGVEDSFPFVCSTLELYFHSEITTINSVEYFRLKNGIPADGSASTITSLFTEGQTGRVSPASNDGKFVYPLTNVTQIPAADWDITYRARRDKADQGFNWLTNAYDISIDTVSGSHNGADDSAILSHSTANFVVDGILLGDTIQNTTDGSSATVTAVTATTVTGTLSGGTQNDWDTGDAYIRAAPTSVWRDINLAPFVPEGATGAIVEVVESNNKDGRSALVRGKEDTRDYMSNAAFNEVRKKQHRWQIVKVDGNRNIQGFTEDVDVDFKLLGYTVGSDPGYIINSGVPPDVTPVQLNQWTTVDVSDYVDSDADGVILLVVHNKSEDKVYGIREVGATLVLFDEGLREWAYTMYLVGLNAQNHFEALVETADFRIYLVGQTKSSVNYYNLDATVADPSIGSWQTLDADDYNIPAISNGLILYVDTNSGTEELGFRHGDSTNDWNRDIKDKTHLQAGVGLNSANQWDMYMQNTSDDVRIAGYTRLVWMDIHTDVDVVVRQADGTIRATLATDVANTGNITGTDWQTYTTTLAFPGYTVVDPTDYLEIDLFAEATLNNSAESVSVEFRFDDPALGIVDQMKAEEMVIP
jgi:hypothetical protein